MAWPAAPRLRLPDIWPSPRRLLPPPARWRARARLPPPPAPAAAVTGATRQPPPSRISPTTISAKPSVPSSSKPSASAVYAKENGIDTYLEPMLRATIRRALAEYAPAARPFRAPGAYDRFIWHLQALFTSRTYEDIFFEKTHRFQVEEVFLVDAATLALVSFASCDPARHASAKRVTPTVQRLALQLRDEDGKIRESFELPDQRNAISRHGRLVILDRRRPRPPGELILADLEFALRRIEDRFREQFQARRLRRCSTRSSPSSKTACSSRPPPARPDRKSYRLKVSINLGPKFSGTRIMIPLHTREVETARTMRNPILGHLQKSGILCRGVVPADEDEAGDSFPASKTSEPAKSPHLTNSKPCPRNHHSLHSSPKPALPSKPPPRHHAVKAILQLGDGEEDAAAVQVCLETMREFLAHLHLLIRPLPWRLWVAQNLQPIFGETA